MGGAMGRRLLDCGYTLTVFDTSPEARRDAESAGAVLVESPGEAAASARTVVTILPDEKVVMRASDGPNGVLSGLRPGTLWLEMSSSHPGTTALLGAAAVADRDALFLDAPVTGGVRKALLGDLTVIAAGADEALVAAGPILGSLAAAVHHVGENPGMGDIVKTINNLLSAANLVMAAEGLAIAAAAGIDLASALAVINSGTGQSNATKWKIPEYVLSGSFDSKFTIDQYLKDLDIAARVADDYDLRLELAPAVQQVWHQLSIDGFGRLDHTEAVTLRIAATRADMRH
jgi:3-hydroxyisobutyrate dehydrogenase